MDNLLIESQHIIASEDVFFNGKSIDDRYYSVSIICTTNIFFYPAYKPSIFFV